MWKAMRAAPLGDDVFDEDPTVNMLQDRMAQLFGMEAALFCPSGTMTNQIALRAQTQPQDEVICHENAHIFLYEGGGMMANSGLSPKLLTGDHGRITARQVAEAVNPEDVHLPSTRLVALENTMNKGGGSIYSFEEIQKISILCREKGLRLHLDGARLFNALIETKESPKDYGRVFDTLSVCFSKGLGAPVGSVLLGDALTIFRAKRWRKAMGGGMRQAGLLAAACMYALDHHVDRLKDDHRRAGQIKEILETHEAFEAVLPAPTNIVIGQMGDGQSQKFLKQLALQDILAIPFGPCAIRWVTHLDFNDDHLTVFEQKIKKIRI